MFLDWIWRFFRQGPRAFSASLHSDTDSYEMLTEAHFKQISLAALSDHDLNYPCDPH